MNSIIIGKITQPVSRIVLGGPFGERSDKESFGILDRFLELGGTAIETAHVYAEGAAEKQIGCWLRERNCRERTVLITKIYHPQSESSDFFINFQSEINISLTRLGVDKVDLLLLHRDPVTKAPLQVLEILEKYRNLGIIQEYGISNIQGKRLIEFDLAANTLGIPPLTIISNYYGLAQQAHSPWPNTVQIDPVGQQWLQKHKRPLLCWSALAQGWFARRQLPENFQTVYDTSLNRLRRQCAEELASQLGATGLQVALAYTFSAPFDVLASVGPRSIEELEEIIGTLRLRLNESECLFLEGVKR